MMTSTSTSMPPHQRLARSGAPLGLGVLFGLGLAISGMLNPRKVQDFLDFLNLLVPGGGQTGWDPSLALVMGGALLVSFVTFPIILRRPRPLLAPRFYLPGSTRVDWQLMVGAALFGAGWGLSGFCPGPALAGAATGSKPAIQFGVAMLAGMALHRAYSELRPPPRLP
jgi:uncharacterized membrane protein YedE/YeeE